MSLLDQMISKARDLCLPLVTTLEITQHCNLKCHHCYNFDRSKEMPEHLKNNVLSSEEILRIIDELSASGALYLNLSGGEVLLHPHLDDFIRKARLNHLEVRIKTNGILLTSERCQRLDTAGLCGLDVSLYGLSDYSYDKITGKAGMLEKALKGIQAAKSQGFNLNINLIMHRYNIHELKSMIEYCQLNDLSYQFSTEITERYDGTNGSKEFEITKEQFSELLRGEFSELFMHNNAEQSLQCSCARSVCGISSAGEVFPCIGAPIPSGNLRSKSFADIWKNSEVLQGIRNLKPVDFKSCSTCEHINYCNRSSGSIYTNTKNYTGCDSITLEQAKSRQEFALEKNL